MRFRLSDEHLALIGLIAFLVFIPYRNALYSATRNYYLVRFVRAQQQTETSLIELKEQILTRATNQPANDALFRIAGMSFLKIGDPERAVTYLLRAHTRNPNSLPTLYWLAQAYEQSGDYENALLTMYQYGNEEYFPSLPEEMTDQELEHLARRLTDRPISTHAHFELAERIYEINQDLTRQHFETAIQSNPKEPESSLRAAWFYLYRGDHDTSKVFGDYARSQFPTYPWVYVFWGTLNRTTGNTEQAIRDWEYAVELAPSGNAGNTAHIALSGVYNEQGEYSRALENLEVANEIQEGQLMVSLQRARAYAGLNECEVAQSQLKNAQALVTTEQQRASYDRFAEIVQSSCQ